MNDEIKVTDKRGAEKEKPKKETKEENVQEEYSEEKTREYAGPISFTAFILSLSSSALIQMGLVPDPVTKKKEKNLKLAKQQIDIIEMLKEKSEGNRSEEEDKILEQALYELRLRFVEASK